MSEVVVLQKIPSPEGTDTAKSDFMIKWFKSLNAIWEPDHVQDAFEKAGEITILIHRVIELLELTRQYPVQAREARQVATHVLTVITGYANGVIQSADMTSGLASVNEVWLLE